MTLDAETRRIIKDLEKIRRERPEVFQLMQEYIELPEDKKRLFIRQVMPILKKCMN